MEYASQAVVTYMAVIVLLNLISAWFYLYTPALRVRHLRQSVGYFRNFYLLMASAFITYGMTFPEMNGLQSAMIAVFFLTAFYSLLYGFKVRQMPDARPMRKSRGFYLNLGLLLFLNTGVFYYYIEDHLIRSALVTSNCSLLAVLTLKYIPRSPSERSYGEKIAFIGVFIPIICAMALLLTLNYTQNLFIYFSALMVSQAVTAVLILGGTQAIFLCDLTDLYYKESVTDELTGLFNRRFFLRQSEMLVKSAERHQFPIAIILCDIDHFKQVNDSYGHALGDIALVEFARILRDNTRESDITARFGGEEFIVLLPQTDIKGANTLAERMREATESLTIHHHDQTVSLTASFGVVTFDHDDTIETHIKRADTQLYRAKSLGRNQVSFQS